MNTKSARFGMILALSAWALVVGSGFQAPSKTFPFTAEEDADGARFVWFIFGQSGFSYEYLPAERFPTSKNFRPAPNNKPQAGDVAWWKEYVAIYAGDEAPEDADLLCASGRLSLKTLEKRFGTVKFYRFWKDESTK